MSVQAISWVLEHSASEKNVRLVLISIANHVDPRGEGWVYVDQVLAEANCSLDSYHRAIRWAIEAGELERDLNEGGARRAKEGRRPNLYRFPALARGSDLAHPTDSEGSAGPVGDPSAGSPPATGGQDAHPEPSLLEPSWSRTPLAPAAPPPKRERQPDVVWEAVIDACGLTGASPTKSERGAWNRAVGDIRATGADPVAIAHRAREFRNRWPGASLTPTALARRWSECVAREAQPERWDGPTIGEDPLLPRARAAVDELGPDMRRYVPRDALTQRAMDVLGQNPSVSSLDLVMALEVWVEANYPLAVGS